MINWIKTTKDNIPEGGKTITAYRPDTLSTACVKELSVPQSGFTTVEVKWFLDHVTHWSYDLVNRPDSEVSCFWCGNKGNYNEFESFIIHSNGHGCCEHESEWTEGASITKSKETIETIKKHLNEHSYEAIWEHLKEARDESDAEGLDRISSGIEILLELINHRQTKI